MATCDYCRRQFAGNERDCPSCGAPRRSPSFAEGAEREAKLNRLIAALRWTAKDDEGEHARIYADLRRLISRSSGALNVLPAADPIDLIGQIAPRL